MAIYIVKNTRGEVVGTYNNQEQAETIAEKLSTAILQHYLVEEICEEEML